MSAGMSALLLFGVMLVLLIIGIPIAYSISVSGIVYLVITGMKSLALIPQRTIISMDSFVLLAIPLFTFMGYLMEQGGLSKRLVDWVTYAFGWIPGSMGTVTIICCTFFAALTGSGPATVAAIGSLMIPTMLKSGYERQDCAGIVAAGGALGPIIPPSVAMIVYGTAMNTSVPTMFSAAILPGLFISVLLILTNVFMCLKKGIKTNYTRVSFPEFMRATARAIFVLMLPIIILGGIYGGIFTATEAAAVGTVYAFILSIAYRQLTWKRLVEAARKTVYTSAMVMFIIGVSGIFAWLLAATRVPATLASMITPILGNKYVYMLVLMLILFVVGCLMDTIPAILILGPILVPIGTAMGWSPIHIGVCFCINLIVGFITPPFGINLFTVTSVAETSFADAVKGVMPYLFTAIIGVMIVAFCPIFTEWMPTLAGMNVW